MSDSGEPTTLTDPTRLTTAALQREIAALKDHAQDALAAEIRVLVTRIDEMQRAIDKASEDYVRVPTLLDRAVAQMMQLMDRRFEKVDAQFDAAEKLRNEKFAQVQGQLRDRDQKAADSSAATKDAVEAALAAAEKAVNKQTETFAVASAKAEAASVKQLDQLNLMIQASTKALDDKITDAKERLTRIEAAAVGRMDTKAETHTASTFTVSLLMLGLTLLGLLGGFLVRSVGH